MKPRIKRSGFSLIEALVVVAISAAVAGITLPAIAKARAVSNRDRCQNNFKVIGESIIKYADAHGGQLPNNRDRGFPGFFPTVLPYMGHDEIAKGLAASGKPWYDPANAAFVSKHLPEVQCPDTPKGDRLMTGTIDGFDFKAAPTDYTAIAQITGAIRNLFPEGHDLSGTMSLNDRRTFADVTDGVSTTLMGIVEIADKPNRWQAGKLLKSDRMGGGGQGTWVANGGNAPRGYSRDGTSFPGPCAMNCANFAAVYSFHPDGCNFLFADGSVRFLKKDIDVWLFYAIVTRRGGESLSVSDF